LENNIGDWLGKARQILLSREIFDDDRDHQNLDYSPRLSSLPPCPPDSGLLSQALLSHVLGKPRPWIISHPEHQVTFNQAKEIEFELERLLNGEPLAYITGHQEFYGMDFLVSPDVLIPRPETELMIDEAAQWISPVPITEKIKVADIGTGSGCIAISLACASRNLAVVGTDISRAALRIANHNIHKHQVQAQVTLVQCDLMAPLIHDYNLVCANLPYIPSQTLSNLRVSQFEPELALDGGKDGLKFIRELFHHLDKKITPHSLMLFEIEASQGFLAKNVAEKHFPKADIKILPDLTGLDRLLRIEHRE
jgi:release factor glutamine methyltransferase